MFAMKNSIQHFRVSSADWEFFVDSETTKDAAMSALIMAFSKYGKDLLLSTTIMVKKIKKSKKRVSFVGTHDILLSLGLVDLAKAFSRISNLPKNDIKRLR